MAAISSNTPLVDITRGERMAALGSSPPLVDVATREERMAAPSCSPPLEDANALRAYCLEDEELTDEELTALVADTSVYTQSSQEDTETEALAFYFELGLKLGRTGESDQTLDRETAAFLANIGFNTMMKSGRGEEAALQEVKNFITHDAFNPRMYSSLSAREINNIVGCFMFGKEKLCKDSVLGRNTQKELEESCLQNLLLCF